MHFKFTGKISEKQRVLFILPDDNLIFSYSLFALQSFSSYFGEKQHIVYPADGKVFLLKYLFSNLAHWFKFKKEKALTKAIEVEKDLDLVINLDIGEPAKYDFPLNKLYFAIARKPLKHATVSYIFSSNNLDQIYTKFPCTLGLPYRDFILDISKEERGKAADFIKYKGHKEKNLIVVCDVPDKKREMTIKEYLSYHTRDRLTFVGQDELKIIDPNLIVPLISLADVFIAEDSIYTYPAQVLGTRTYLFKGKSKSLPKVTPRLFIEKEDFKKEILLLLPFKK